MQAHHAARGGPYLSMTQEEAVALATALGVALDRLRGLPEARTLQRFLDAHSDAHELGVRAASEAQDRAVIVPKE